MLRFCEVNADLLPTAVWIPVEQDLPAIYRGSPLDMVEAMAHEMEPDLCPKDAILAILGGLARNRNIHIHLDAASNLPDETFASLFICALLDQHIAKPLPSA